MSTFYAKAEGGCDVSGGLAQTPAVAFAELMVVVPDGRRGPDAGQRHFSTGADVNAVAANGRVSSGDGPMTDEVFWSARHGWALLRMHWAHPDFAEGPRAFAERREPKWTT
jgi:enoyl-CoA hydratase/carnithine racemase